MACRVPQRHGTLFHLPRSSLWRSNICQRHFSASTPCHGPITDIVVAGPTAVIDAVHGLGIPYYAALPLTAVIVRGTFVYYLSSRPARRQAVLTNNLIPLIQSRVRLSYLTYQLERMRQARQGQNARNPAKLLIDSRVRLLVYWFQARSKYAKLFGGRSMLWGLLNFGVLIAFAESIRLKCGRTQGLLSLLLTPAERLAGVPVGTSEDTLKVDPAEALAARLEAARDAQITNAKGGELVDLSNTRASAEAILSGQHPSIQLDPTPIVDTSSPYFDPALQAEGLSWCTDLTLVDSTNVLPTMFAVVIFATMLRPAVNKIASNLTPPTQPSDEEDFRPKQPLYEYLVRLNRRRVELTLMQQIQITGAILFSIIAYNLPAAILLYIMPNMVTGWLQNRYLDLKSPIRPPILPCKRQLRFSPKREWED